MADQLPQITESRAVNATATPTSSLIGRALIAIQNKEIGIARTELDAPYRKARNIYNRITNDGNQDCTGNCWADEELAELAEVFETFKTLADYGYGKAYFPISQFYKGKQSVPENNHLSRFYSKLAFAFCFDNRKQNDPDIWNDLGTLYRLGEAVELDYKLALHWYQTAAGIGDATGMFNVSCMYEFGLGVEQDYDEALSWQMEAAVAGHTNAQFGIGYQYEHDTGLLEQDDELAFYWYLQAAERGHKKAKFCVAQYSWEGLGFPEDDELAFGWYLEQANAGEVWAQWFLAVAYKNGHGINQDDKLSLFWYRKAAEQGNPNAQNLLGDILDDGCGIARDRKEAYYWYSKAAESGLEAAQINLALYYYHGYGDVVQSYEKAAFWNKKAGQHTNFIQAYRKALVAESDEKRVFNLSKQYAEQDVAEAQFDLGWMYQYGHGVEQNFKEAAYWYTQAAEQSHRAAQWNLGWMYSLGDGVNENHMTSVFWLEKAIDPKYNTL